MTALTERLSPTPSAERATPSAAHEEVAQAATDGPGKPTRTPGRHRRARAFVRWWLRLVRRVRASADDGMATAEYAIVTVAAVAFAGLLIVVLRSDEVRGLLMGIIRGALSV